MSQFKPRRKILSSSISAMVAIGAWLAASPAQAYDTQLGNYDLSINSTLSAGISIRTQGRSKDLYAVSNRDVDGQTGRGGSNTSDDGNLNFESGDTFSTVVKGVHDFDLKGDGHGFFGRVKWFYDYTLNNKEVPHGNEPNGNAKFQTLDDGGFHPFAKFDGINLLDAFGYLNTNVGDKPLDIRLGRQVISWGESTLLLSPIAGLNTIDVSAFRRPGADLKEGFTPSEMLYANLGATDNTSVEGFVQLQWRETVPEGCGTYFSTNDFAAEGCSRIAFAGPAVFAASQGQVVVGDREQLAGATDRVPNATAPGGALTLNPVTRAPDRTPDDMGQFGLAVRTYVQPMDTEFGAYYMNYHSRLPLVSLKAGSRGNPQTGGQTALPYAFGGNDGQYFIDYPEDISVFGLSFATNVGGWAWSGEFSHAQDIPLQYNANDLLSAALFAGATNPAGPNQLDRKVGSAAPGQLVDGFERFDVSQIQTTFIKTFDRALGASTVALVAEVGAVFVSDLPEVAPGQRFGRNPVFGTADGTRGYVTDFSWGYRLRSRAVYRNVLGNVDLLPGVAYAHDVRGYSPEPGQIFNEDRQSLGLNLGFEFDANNQANISYTTFADNAKFDPLRDRDFVSVTYSLSF